MRTYPLMLLVLLCSLASPALAQNCSGPFSLTNQEPVGCLPYGSTLWNSPLPADVMSHLAANSDAMAKTTLTDNGNLTSSNWGATYLETPGISDIQPPRYYATASDPVYKIASCNVRSGTSSNFNPIGKSFHMPSGAQFSKGGSDQFLSVFDQTQNAIIEFYTYAAGNIALPACSGTCSLSVGYSCTYANWNDASGRISNAGNTLGSTPWALELRAQELVQGQINHPLYVLVRCENGVVFPGYGLGAGQCASAYDSSTPTTNRPPQGSLIFVDYTPTQINAMAIPAWKKAILRAMSTYGAYIGDTGGAGRLGGMALRAEGSQAYYFSGVTWPIPAFAAANNIPTTGGGTSGEVGYIFSWASGIPTVNGADITGHIHIADPCVAKGLAGISGGCGTATASAPAAPTGLAATVN